MVSVQIRMMRMTTSWPAPLTCGRCTIVWRARISCGLQRRPQQVRGPSCDRPTAAVRDGALHGSSRVAGRRWCLSGRRRHYGLRSPLDRRASVYDTSHSRLIAKTSVYAERSHWRTSAEPHEARTAFGWAIRQAIRAEYPAMTSIGRHRPVARCGMHLSASVLRGRIRTTGRQGKSAASGRAHMVGRLEFCTPSALRAGWPFSRKPQRFQRRGRRRRLIEPIFVR
jgi:hypothetical protein